METIKRLSYKIHADTDTGCLYRYVKSENEYFRLHCHDYFEIFLIVRGNITHLINGTSQTLSEGSLVFIRPDDVHNFKCRGSRTFANLTFTKETCRELSIRPPAPSCFTQGQGFQASFVPIGSAKRDPMAG